MSVSFFGLVVIKYIIVPLLTLFVGCFPNILFFTNLSSDKMNDRHTIAIELKIYLKSFTSNGATKLISQIESSTDSTSMIKTFKSSFLFDEWREFCSNHGVFYCFAFAKTDKRFLQRMLIQYNKYLQRLEVVRGRLRHFGAFSGPQRAF